MKNWIKEHKDGIKIGSCVIGLGALGLFTIKNCKTKISTTGSLSNCINDIGIHLDTATVTEAWKETYGDGFIGLNFILNDFKASDIGKLGEDLVKNVPEITEDTVLTCVLGTTSK